MVVHNNLYAGAEVVMVEEEHPGDTGCEYYHSCLSCPFPECKEDAGVRKFTMELKLKKVAELLRLGKEPAEIVIILGISRKTVLRRVSEIEKYHKELL